MNELLTWSSIYSNGSLQKQVGVNIWTDLITVKPVFTFSYDHFVYDVANSIFTIDTMTAMSEAQKAECQAVIDASGPDYAWHEAVKKGEIEMGFADACLTLDNSSIIERDSWPTQQAEAAAWAADNSALTPFIDVLHTNRNIVGETREDLINKINLKVSKYSSEFPILLGKYHGYLKALDAATVQGDLDAIVVDYSYTV